MWKQKKERGITLVALVITIIILLILAGVSINFLFGQDGIFNKTQTVVDKYNKAEAEEKINLKLAQINMTYYSDYQRKASLREIANNLCTDEEVEYLKAGKLIGALEPIDLTGYSSFFVKLKAYVYEFEIGEDTQVAIVGVNSGGSNTPSIQTVAPILNPVTITYDANGGSGTMSNSVGDPAIVEKNGFTAPNEKVFKEWNTESDGSGTSYVPGTTISKDELLYAIWIVPVSSILKEGDWVKYDTGVTSVGTNGVISCRVLYNDQTHGLQIISASSVARILFAGNGYGSEICEKSLADYNDAIEILNGTKQQGGETVGAEKYLNTDYAYDARCVGSVPIVDENGMFIEKNSETPGPTTLPFEFNGSTSIDAKGEDTNYDYNNEGDWTKMGSLGTPAVDIRYPGDGIVYYLASRTSSGTSDFCDLQVRYYDTYWRRVSGGTFISVNAVNSPYGSERNLGLRPCFSLKSNIKILDGTGKTEGNAYILGI